MLSRRALLTLAVGSLIAGSALPAWAATTPANTACPDKDWLARSQLLGTNCGSNAG